MICGIVYYWRHLTRVQYRWFLVGAGLSVLIVTIGYRGAGIFCWILLPLFWLLGRCGVGLFMPYLVMSSYYCLSKVGITALAGVIWKRLGKDADTAIAVGIGTAATDVILRSFFSVFISIKQVTSSDRVIRSSGFSVWNNLLNYPLLHICSLIIYIAAYAIVFLGIAGKQYAKAALGFGLIILYESLSIICKQALPGKPELIFWLLGISGIFAGISIKIIINIYKKWNSKKLEADSVKEEVAEDISIR